MARLQAASALGQARLQAAWEEALGNEGIPAAQILLAAGDVADRAAYVNARQAFAELFRLGAVPVVNENDATATDEITFGDNDALAAQVAVLVRARLLVLLTEVEGVYSRAPGTPGAELIAEGALARDAELGVGTALGRGGMGSKVVAAQMASAAGIPTVIAGGRRRRGARPDPRRRGAWHPLHGGRARRVRLQALASLRQAGRRHAARRRGREGGARRQGREPARRGSRPLRGRASSPAMAVELVGPDGVAFGKGIAGAGADELAGRPRGLEAVHRDRLVLF